MPWLGVSTVGHMHIPPILQPPAKRSIPFATRGCQPLSAWQRGMLRRGWPGRSSQLAELGSVWEIRKKKKKKTQPHTLSLSHSLTPPCAAKLNNDVIVVGEKQHNLCPSCRGEGREGCTTFFLISPCSLPSNSPWGGKVNQWTRIWGAGMSPRLCLGYGIPRISSPPWTGFLSPLQGGP